MWAISTWSTYTMGWVVDEVINKNLRLFPILFKQFKHLQHCFFDVKQLTGEWGMSLKPKDIPWIESTITVDGSAIKWLDYGLFDFNTKIKTAVTGWTIWATNDFDVDDSAWFAVNDIIAIIRNEAWTSQAIDGIVTAIPDSDTITVKVQTLDLVEVSGWESFDISAWARVERLYWTRKDNDEITRPSANYELKEYKSYIQHFSRRLEFTKAELNQEYVYAGDAKEMVAKNFSYNLWILFQEVNKALYKGKNRWPWAGANDKMEMLWLEHIARENGAIIDLSWAADPIKDLFAQFEKAFQSGSVLGHESLTLLVNDKFLSELSRAELDKVVYNEKVDALDMSIPTLTTAFGKVELVRDPMLNKLYAGFSVAFTMPKSLIKLWVRENQTFQPKGWITKADQSIRIYPVVHNLREKELFDMEFELWLIAGWMSADDSSYRMLTGFTMG